MTVEAGLFERLSGDAAVAALVVDRIYPKTAPQGTKAASYIVYHKVTFRPQRSLTGATLKRGTWQIDAWANDFDLALSIAHAMTAALDNFRGNLGGRGLVVNLDTERDDYEPDTRLYRQSLDFIVWDCGPA